MKRPSDAELDLDKRAASHLASLLMVMCGGDWPRASAIMVQTLALMHLSSMQHRTDVHDEAFVAMIVEALRGFFSSVRQETVQ